MATVVIRSEQHDNNNDKDNTNTNRDRDTTTTSTTSNSYSRVSSEKLKQQQPIEQQKSSSPSIDQPATNVDNQQTHIHYHQAQTTTNNKSTQSDISSASPTSTAVVYDVEHLATFSSNHRQSNAKFLQSNKYSESSLSSSSTGNTNQLGSSENNSDEYNSDADCNLICSNSKSCLTNFKSECREPKEALRKLFMLEKFSGIWTQRMQIKLKGDHLRIKDCETNSIVERFHRDCVTRPEAISHYNDIYNNIIVFVIQRDFSNSRKVEATGKLDHSPHKDHKSGDKLDDDGELHIFHCVSHKAQQLVADILNWKQLRQQTNESQDTDIKMANNNKIRLNENDDSSSRSEIEQPGAGERRLNSTTTTKHDNPSQKSTANNKPAAATTTTAAATCYDKSTSCDSNSRPMVTVASCASNNDSLPIANVNVKETVQVFNQIAALREKGSKPTSPTGTARPSNTDTSAAVKSPDLISSDLALESATGQFYKQRSIRATLAPKQQQQQQQGNNHSNTNDNNNNDNPTADQRIGSCSGDQKRSHVNYGSSISSTSASVATKSSTSNSQLTNNHTTEQHMIHHHNHHQHSDHQHVEGGSKLPSSSNKGIDPSIYRHSGSTAELQQQKGSSKSSSTRRTKDLEVPLPNYDQSEQVTTNESYVSVLNHCFDDIEKFIIRLQQAVAAKRELHNRRKLLKQQHRSAGYSNQDPIKTGSAALDPAIQISASELAILNARASGPNEDDYFEILSKFKLAFNLLAKLKGCIHEPNAPELVHFLFTPLAIVIESARNVTPPVDPTLVNVPYLNRDALELLSNCCTSKESDLWLSLGPNWTQTIDIKILRASRLPNSFQPIFTDGWAPVITELELIGLVAPRTASPFSESNTAVGNNYNIRESTGAAIEGPYAAAVVSANEHVDYQVDGSHYKSTRNGNGPSKASSGYQQHHSSNSGSSSGRKQRLSSPNQLVHGKDQSNSSSGYDYPQHLDESQFDDIVSGSGAAAIQSTRAHRSANRVKRSLAHGAHIASHNQHQQQLMQLQQQQQQQQPSHRLKSQSSRRAESSRFYIADPLQTSDCDLNHPVYLDGSEAIGPPATDCIDLRRSDMMMHNYIDYERPLHELSPSSSNEIRRDRLDPAARQASHVGRGDIGRAHPRNRHHNNMPPLMVPFEQMSDIEREAMLMDLGPAQTEWFFELQARGAMIVRVLFTREANNDKELSVHRGELLEVLDDSRKWWKARNIDLQVAHVPHTIVARMDTYQTLDELLTGDSVDYGPGPYHEQHRRGISEPIYHYHGREDRPSRKTAGAFRYF